MNPISNSSKEITYTEQTATLPTWTNNKTYGIYTISYNKTYTYRVYDKQNNILYFKFNLIPTLTAITYLIPFSQEYFIRVMRKGTIALSGKWSLVKWAASGQNQQNKCVPSED